MVMTVTSIIDLHGATKIAAAIGVSAGNVRMWKQRNRIPAEHWRDLAAHKFATLEQLAEMAARQDAA